MAKQFPFVLQSEIGILSANLTTGSQEAASNGVTSGDKNRKTGKRNAGHFLNAF